MDSLSTFRHLTSHPELTQSIEESDISKVDRLMVLTLTLRACGFTCEIRTRDMFFKAPGRSRLRNTIFAVFLPSSDGSEQCIDIDGVEGDEAVLLCHLQAKRVDGDRAKFVFESSSEWQVLERMSLAISEGLYPRMQRGETCHRLIDMATSVLQAHALERAAEQVVHAPGGRSRI